MVEYVEPDQERREEDLESKFNRVGIGAVTAAAKYCSSLKAKTAKTAPHASSKSTVIDTD